MTKLTSGKSLARETAATDRRIPLIVELHPGFMVLRKKGERKSAFSLDYGAAYDLAQKLDWKAKAAARKRA